jgi:hypothetical protein
VYVSVYVNVRRPPPTTLSPGRVWYMSCCRSIDQIDCGTRTRVGGPAPIATPHRPAHPNQPHTTPSSCGTNHNQPLRQLVRASLTCKEAWALYWEVQGRVRALRAKNVERRRKRQALFSQLQASRGLEVLSLVNVQHPSSSACLTGWWT